MEDENSWLLDGYPIFGNGEFDVMQDATAAAATGDLSDLDPFTRFWNWITGKDKQSREFLQQNYLLDKEHENALELQQNEMDYNSEVARVQRMREAGLNVNLMSRMQGGSIGTSHEVGAPSVPSQASPVPALAGGLDSLMNSFNEFSQIGKIRAEARNFDANTLYTNILSGLKPLESEVQRELWRAEANKYVADGTLSEQNAAWVEKQAQFFADTIDIRTEQLRQDVNETKERVHLLIQDVKNREQEFRNLEKQGEVLDAEKILMGSETSKNYAQASMFEQHGEMYHEQAQGQSWQNYVLRYQKEQIENVFNGLPYPIDWGNVIALYSTGKEEDIKQADNMLNALCNAYQKQYGNQVEAAWQNYWPQFLMNFGQGVGNSMQYLPFMLLGRGGRGASKGAGQFYPPTYNISH